MPGNPSPVATVLLQEAAPSPGRFLLRLQSPDLFQAGGSSFLKPQRPCAPLLPPGCPAEGCLAGACRAEVGGTRIGFRQGGLGSGCARHVCMGELGARKASTTGWGLPGP